MSELQSNCRHLFKQKEFFVILYPTQPNPNKNNTKLLTSSIKLARLSLDVIQVSVLHYMQCSLRVHSILVGVTTIYPFFIYLFIYVDALNSFLFTTMPSTIHCIHEKDLIYFMNSKRKTFSSLQLYAVIAVVQTFYL